MSQNDNLRILTELPSRDGDNCLERRHNDESIRQARKKMDALCDTPDGVIVFKWYQVVPVIALVVAMIAVAKTFIE